MKWKSLQRYHGNLQHLSAPTDLIPRDEFSTGCELKCCIPGEKLNLCTCYESTRSNPLKSSRFKSAVLPKLQLGKIDTFFLN